jgi:hypothetical protein
MAPQLDDEATQIVRGILTNARDGNASQFEQWRTVQINDRLHLCEHKMMLFDYLIDSSNSLSSINVDSLEANASLIESAKSQHSAVRRAIENCSNEECHANEAVQKFQVSPCPTWQKIIELVKGQGDIIHTLETLRVFYPTNGESTGEEAAKQTG